MPTPQLCIHAQNGRKCQYVGNCSFAHSPEERDMWTFMKENKSEWADGVGGPSPSVSSVLKVSTHQRAQERLLHPLLLPGPSSAYPRPGPL